MRYSRVIQMPSLRTLLSMVIKTNVEVSYGGAGLQSQYFGRLRQENHRFMSILGNLVTGSAQCEGPRINLQCQKCRRKKGGLRNARLKEKK